MMQFRPLPPIGNLHRREVYSVEIDVVLAHELVKINIFRIEPPLLPFGQVVGGYTWVSDGGIKLVCGQASAVVIIT